MTTCPSEGRPEKQESVDVTEMPDQSQERTSEGRDSQDRGPQGRGPQRGGFGGGDQQRRWRRPHRFPRRKVCPFCANKIDHIDYKDVPRLRRFVTDRGKMLSRRVTGCCSRHQRILTAAIKRARNVALLPYKGE